MVALGERMQLRNQHTIESIRVMNLDQSSVASREGPKEKEPSGQKPPQSGNPKARTRSNSRPPIPPRPQSRSTSAPKLRSGSMTPFRGRRRSPKRTQRSLSPRRKKRNASEHKRNQRSSNDARSKPFCHASHRNESTSGSSVQERRDGSSNMIVPHMERDEREPPPEEGREVSIDWQGEALHSTDASTDASDEEATHDTMEIRASESLSIEVPLSTGKIILDGLEDVRDYVARRAFMMNEKLEILTAIEQVAEVLDRKMGNVDNDPSSRLDEQRLEDVAEVLSKLRGFLHKLNGTDDH